MPSVRAHACMCFISYVITFLDCTPFHIHSRATIIDSDFHSVKRNKEVFILTTEPAFLIPWGNGFCSEIEMVGSEAGTDSDGIRMNWRTHALISRPWEQNLHPSHGLLSKEVSSLRRKPCSDAGIATWHLGDHSLQDYSHWMVSAQYRTLLFGFFLYFSAESPLLLPTVWVATKTSWETSYDTWDFSVAVSLLFFSSSGWKRHSSSSRVSGHNEAQRSACWFLCWTGQLIELPFVCLSKGHFRSLHFNHHLGLKCHGIDLLDAFTVSQGKGGQCCFCPFFHES